MYACSSKTEQEQAFKITMTPALYHCTTQTWYVLSACGLKLITIIISNLRILYDIAITVTAQYTMDTTSYAKVVNQFNLSEEQMNEVFI